MTHNNDKPSERSPADQAKVDDLSRRVGGRTATARAPERLVIRTAANRFDIPLDEIPPGMTYEWKVMRVNNQEAQEQIIAWRLNGWKEVPAGRHPSFTGESEDSTASINRGGQVLCERPAELTAQSRSMEREAAKDQVQSQLDRLAGRARATQSERITKLEKSWTPITDD